MVSVAGEGEGEMTTKSSCFCHLQQLFTQAHEEEKKKCEEAERLKNEGKSSEFGSVCANFSVVGCEQF